MKRNLRSVVVSTSVLAITGGVLAATVGTAAASYPGTPWQPAPSSEQIGTLALYNSAGVQVTGGSNINHMFDYALASSVGPTDPNGIANLEFANPQPGVDPGNFATVGDESSNYPNASAPGVLKNNADPLVTLDSAGANLAAVKGGFVKNTATGYANVYEVRAYTTDAGSYWAADIQVNSDNSWTELFGTNVGTTTTVSASPNPQGSGGSVTLTATVTDADGTAPAGTVTFTSGSTTLGSSSTFNSSGQATATTTALPQGTDSVTATFVPSNSGGITYNGSNASTSETISAPVPSTTTTLGISGDTTTGTDATLSGSVTPSGAAGTVEFFDNGSSTPLAVTGGPSVPVTSGAYTATLAGGFAKGSHSVVAQFTPTDPTAYGPSQSSAVAFNTIAGAAAGSTCAQTGSDCTDTQTIEGEIPTGTLVISTPYTDAKPLDVGPLALSSDGTYYTGSATFKCITVTDASSGGSPFVASALANPLSQVSGSGNPAQNTSHAFTTINGENVGLTGLGESTGTCPDGSTPTESYVGIGGTPSSVTVASNPAAKGVAPSDTGTAGLGNAPHTILTGTSGDDGTATYDGTLTLNAPTSTASGTYKGTVIFTVTD